MAAFCLMLLVGQGHGSQPLVGPPPVETDPDVSSLASLVPSSRYVKQEPMTSPLDNRLASPQGIDDWYGPKAVQK